MAISTNKIDAASQARGTSAAARQARGHKLQEFCGFIGFFSEETKKTPRPTGLFQTSFNRNNFLGVLKVI